MNSTLEVFGYVRVSGKGQLDGDGFARQEEAIKAFAVKKGWLVKRVFREEAVSGTVESTDRPAFSEMLSLCGGVLPTTIVVERSDRLARDLIVGELLFRECKSRGVMVWAADSEEELVNAESDPTRLLIRQVLGALAEWEKSSLVKKLRSARQRKKFETGRCEGRIPLSESNPEEYWRAKDWIDMARARGESYHSITKQLNLSIWKGPRGGRWTSSTVYSFANNPRNRDENADNLLTTTRP